MLIVGVDILKESSADAKEMKLKKQLGALLHRILFDIHEFMKNTIFGRTPGHFFSFPISHLQV